MFVVFFENNNLLITECPVKYRNGNSIGVRVRIENNSSQAK